MEKIIIFCTKNNKETVGLQLKELENTYEILIQTPDVSTYEHFKEKYRYLSIRDDKEFENDVIQSELKKGAGKKRGWYWQQYLKLRSIDFEEKRFLILDGDTFLKKSVINDIFEHNYRLAVKENFDVYNRLIKLVLPKVHLLKYSAVANCSLVEPKIIRKQIKNTQEFFLTLISKMGGDYSSARLDISEYQIINTIQQNETKIFNLHLFRRGELLTKKNIGKIRKADKICYHGYAKETNHHRNFVKTVIANIIFMLRYKKW